MNHRTDKEQAKISLFFSHITADVCVCDTSNLYRNLWSHAIKESNVFVSFFFYRAIRCE